MAGVRPDGEPFLFTLPKLRVSADYLVGRYRGSREATFETLVLLPEESRFYVVHHLPFTVPPGDGRDRSMRVRVELSP